ncbi:hypothetical protein QYE76_056630 [Lolium multiflorum]|uniref:Transposase (putative) gypsy type domain-containing protein n=1 Tax=Lolium multiflorum TaxID=4521 RepID=A0AAD8WNB0_LOLMU|nr:hypothetical protein QYE76_056630 [Lolium multiflorum]
MAAKVQEAENKRASKARIREGERGQWWPCETTDMELRELQNEGMISAHWSFIRDTDVPKPGAGEVVMTKAWVERGLSLPCSEFFLSILNTYGLQPHNICPNSYLLLSNFATLCEGHLGIRPDVKLWQFFFRVKKETKDKAMLDTLAEENFCTILRVPVSGDAAEEVPDDEEEEEEQAPRKAAPRPSKRPRAKASGSEAGASGEASAKKPKTIKPPPLNSKKAERERLKMLSTAGKRSRPIIPGAPNPSTTATRTTSQEPITKWAEKILKPKALPKMKQKYKAKERLRSLLPREPEPEQQALHYELHKNIALQLRVTLSQAENIRTLKNENAELNKQLADAQGASSSLVTASSELENLRPSYQELETKLMEAEQKREQAEKQLAEKNSELTREKGEFLLKRNADIETIKRQQKELNGLRKYMETAERHWDLLNENILEPLGYPEKRRNRFPRDDLLTIAGDDCKDLISASRKICHNLSLKKSRTCGLRKLVKKMDILPELVTDLQASSARGAAAMTLTMCLAHNSELDLEQVTTGVPPDADVGALLDAVSGYDTHIARRIRHEEFYDKVVLPADEPLEAELQKERDAEARPAESGTQFTWTSSKDAPQEEPKESAAASKRRKKVMRTCRLRPRMPRKGTQKAKLLRLRRSENFIPAGKNNASFWPQRGFVI